MKKTVIIIAGVLILAAAYFFGSGFLKEHSAYIGEYSASPDGREMTVTIEVANSAGYVRKIAIQQQGGKAYLDCYSCFGGFNSAFGAKSTYSIPLNEDTESIALRRNADCYEDVLKKDGGIWQRVS